MGTQGVSQLDRVGKNSTLKCLFQFQGFRLYVRIKNEVMTNGRDSWRGIEWLDHSILVQRVSGSRPPSNLSKSVWREFSGTFYSR